MASIVSCRELYWKDEHHSSKSYPLRDLVTLKATVHHVHHFHPYETIQWALVSCSLGRSHPTIDHSHLDRNASLCDKGHQSEEFWIDLKRSLPLSGHLNTFITCLYIQYFRSNEFQYQSIMAQHSWLTSSRVIVRTHFFQRGSASCYRHDSEERSHLGLVFRNVDFSTFQNSPR